MTMSDCTEPNRAKCPRLCHDFCNKAETEKAHRHCLDAAGSRDMCLFCGGTGTEHYDLRLSERTLCDHCDGTGHENDKDGQDEPKRINA